MKSGENGRTKFVSDYKEELCEIFPFIHEREMGKILKRLSTIVSSYLGKGMRGMKIFPKEYANNTEKYINRIAITKTRGKSSEVGTGFRYKTILASRIRKAREYKINEVTLDIKEKKIEGIKL